MFSIKINVLIGSLLVCLIGCSNFQTVRKPAPNNYQQLLNDEAFPGYKKHNIESLDEVFALDAQMEDFVEKRLIPEKNYLRKARKLLKHIFSKEDINLAYQNNANLTASQAYHSQTANCMSLTIMAYALATEAGLNVKFQSIKVPEYWVRNGEHNMLTGHVNLSVSEKRASNVAVVYGDELMQIDFDPEVYRRSFPKKTITKQDMLAMFYNNKGAGALVQQNYDKAYAYFKSAIIANPTFSSSWGNLGVLYKLTKQYDLAKKSYNTAIALDNDNLTAYKNLTIVLSHQGENKRVEAIKQMLHEKRHKNPFYHAMLADEALYRGEYQLAKRLFKKAIRLEKKGHEFYFGLARVYFALKETDKAENAIKKAISYNRYPSTENQYIAKLNVITQHNE
ncbi:tetratricopeptide repeat protein [Thalassotalea sp. PP2-459]|uniref:tetratricopeptide repeat protein n=1 Tax=Thalassotalea sp. PP2-459 TaxID=1742724 RepID=UPI0009F8230B|nr:tetratricopeptide repeat protein [Thalassotalea sp. PP2-459]